MGALMLNGQNAVQTKWALWIASHPYDKLGLKEMVALDKSHIGI